MMNKKAVAVISAAIVVIMVVTKVTWVIAYL